MPAANTRMEELHLQLDDKGLPDEAVESLDELEAGQDSEDGAAARALDSSVTLQFRLLQSQLAREKAAREKAQDQADEALAKAAEAKDSEFNWHEQYNELESQLTE